MPIEIREVIIKTEIQTAKRNEVLLSKSETLETWKRQVLDECKRMVLALTKKNRYTR